MKRRAFFYGGTSHCGDAIPSRECSVVDLEFSGFILDSRPGLGRILDAQRALAGADRHMAFVRLRRSGIESARSSLFWPDCVVLARPPVLQHLPGLLHRGVPAVAPAAAGEVHR